MSKSFGLCAVFRKDQLAGGVYSFCENLMRGFGELSAMPEFANEIQLTVFHAPSGVRWHDKRAHFRQVSDRMSRFGAWTMVGAYGSRGMDAMLFPSYFTPPIVRAGRTVTVIHDLLFRHLPQFHSPVKRIWLHGTHRWSLHRCDAVVAISQAVRQDILNEYGCRFESRVHAIHNPISLERFNGVSERSFTGGRPYILCAAMDRPLKNLFTLVRGFDRIKNRFPDHLLVMAGQLRRHRPDRREKSARIASTMPSTEDLVKALGLQDRVVVTGFVSDAELGGLYRGASVFVLPSLFEGFGMPAVEALAMGAPTLVSDLPVLREVTLGGAHYVGNPRCEDELSERIGTILNDPGAARPTSELIQQLRSQYAPRTIARRYYELLAG